MKPPEEVRNKTNEKLHYKASANKMSSGPIPYYDGYDSYDFSKKKFHLIKPLTEVKRNT